MSTLEIREKYMQLSRRLLLASENGGSEEEIRQLHKEIKALEPQLQMLGDINGPDCP